MKKFYLFSIAILASALLSAQSDSTIYGLKRNFSTQEIWLSSLEPSTGVVTTISDTSVATYYTWNTLSTIDPYQQIYYFAEFNQLKGIDLNTGETVSSNPVQPDGYYMDFMQFNVADSTIYCIARATDSTPQNIQQKLATIDPTTGELSMLSDSSLTSLFSVSAMAAIDPIQMVYYFASASGEIRGIDMTTGNLATSAQLDLEANTYLEFLRYNYSDTTLYALKRNSVTTGFHLCTIDPITGAVNPRTIDPFGSGLLVANGLGTIDPNNEIFYFLGALTEGIFEIQLYGLDLQSGEIVVETLMSGIDDTYFDMMLYFPDMCPPGLLFPLSTGTITSDEFALYPNPAQGSFSLTHPEAAHGADYRLINSIGQQVQAGKLSHNSTTIDVATLPPGLYIVQVYSASAKMSKRVVVY